MATSVMTVGRSRGCPEGKRGRGKIKDNRGKKGEKFFLREPGQAHETGWHDRQIKSEEKQSQEKGSHPPYKILLLGNKREAGLVDIQEKPKLARISAI